MKKMLFLLTIGLLFAFLAACGAAETPTEEPTPVPPTPEEVLQTTSLESILDITWQWMDLVETDPASQSIVPDPENYTLIFRADGTTEIKADCNQVLGSYTQQGSALIITMGPSTLAACGEDSLDQQYLASLDQVNTFGMLAGDLKLAGESFTMGFDDGGSAEVELVNPDDLQNKLWAWERHFIPETNLEERIADPSSYTLTFNADETYAFKADCNLGSGNYTATEKGQIQFEAGPLTLAECGPDSRYQDMLTMLSTVQEYSFEENGEVLVLSQPGGGPMDYFRVTEPETVSACPVVDPAYIRLDTQGLPYFWQANTVPGTPYDNSLPPGAIGLPPHIQVNFGVVNPQDRLPGDPIIYIIPVDEYVQLWEQEGDDSVTRRIEQLQEMLSEQPEPFPTSGLPVLPFEEVTGVNDLAVQGEYLDFDWFSGVRFVGRFSQDPNPVINENLFYIFQGFNEDSSCLISFFYPVRTDLLPDTAEDVSADELESVDSDPSAYLDGKIEALNNLIASDWDPDLNTLDAVIGSLAYVPPAQAGTSLTGVLWGWTELTETQPASQSIIPDPENYTLVFQPDNGLQILADCNSGFGTYTIDGEQMSIEIGVLTTAICGADSLSSLFLDMLGRVDSYELSQEELVLNLAEVVGTMRFTNLGPGFSIPGSGEGVPTAVAIEPINVRSGPGSQYSSYGVVSIGTSGEVIGISEDGEWWVVKVSIEYAPDGRGWVKDEFVEVTNAEHMPVIPTPPLGDVEFPPPDAGAPTATVLQSVNVRGGPSTDYPSFGIAPAGAIAPVVGISEDGLWWVVKIPVDLSPEGQGWVSADFVEVIGGEDAPVIPNPPAP
ncbi:MAG TPA: META domain-containing protein [Anaerolineales bacterium]|nr:META domain-containing protein [Anaerolineales bacterium]